MDAATLRNTFALVGIVLLALFYIAAYRPTRAAYAGWWTVTLLCFTASDLAYLGDGTSAQVVLNPIGNALAVAGAEAALCAGRSLYSRRLPWRVLAIGPAVALVIDALHDPRTSSWSGGLVFLLLMALTFFLTARELFVASGHPPDHDTSYIFLTRFLAVASVLLGLYYLARDIAFAVVDPFSDTFVNWFGTGPTTLALTVLLISVSFSMSSLTNAQQMSELRRQATMDSLTGLPNRREFLRRAAIMLHEARRGGHQAAVVMGDLDHFKRINDDLGHATGDDVLRAFAAAARDVLHPGDLLGRIGGEEFALILPHTGLDTAQLMLEQLCATFADRARGLGVANASVSFGLATSTPSEDLTLILERADAALYRAKEAGRARVVRA